MLIKNTGDAARSISREGVDIPLMPGAAVDVHLTKHEAEAFRGLGFDVTGEPDAAKPVAVKAKE